jgi:transcriptional regulator with XRE-family HTH domain
MTSQKELRKRHKVSIIQLARTAKITSNRLRSIEKDIPITEQELRKLERGYLELGINAKDELIKIYEEYHGKE